MQHKEFLIFVDASQKVTLAINEKRGDYYEIESKTVSAVTGEVQAVDTIELHKSELKALGEWIVSNVWYFRGWLIFELSFLFCTAPSLLTSVENVDFAVLDKNVDDDKIAAVFYC